MIVVVNVANESYQPKMPADFITTLDSDDDEGSQLGESSNRHRTPAKEDDLDPDFEFDLSGGGVVQELQAWGGDELIGASSSITVSHYKLQAIMSDFDYTACDCGRYHCSKVWPNSRSLP